MSQYMITLQYIYLLLLNSHAMLMKRDLVRSFDLEQKRPYYSSKANRRFRNATLAMCRNQFPDENKKQKHRSESKFKSAF